MNPTVRQKMHNIYLSILNFILQLNRPQKTS